MSQQDATLAIISDKVTGTALESEIPSHTQNDDLFVKAPSLEQSAEVGSVIPAVIAGYRAFQQFAPEPDKPRFGPARASGLRSLFLSE
jgi:hypothetical protein